MKETKAARHRRLDRKWRNGTATRAEIMECMRELRPQKIGEKI